MVLNCTYLMGEVNTKMLLLWLLLAKTFEYHLPALVLDDSD